MKSVDISHPRGFSLVEVTIAMAIASVAVVTLIGLIPQGMSTMRAAGDKAIEGRINQQILGELQMASYDSLDTYDKMEVYYDDQGEELGDSKSGATGKGGFSHIYSARISIPKISGGKVPDSVGGGSYDGVKFDGSKPNENLRLVILEVAAVGGRGGNFDWGEDENQDIISTYQSFVVKMGQDYSAP